MSTERISCPNFATIAEIATLFGVSRSTIFRWLKAGMPRAVARGRVIRLDANAVQAWLSAPGKTAPGPVVRRGRPRNHDRAARALTPL